MSIQPVVERRVHRDRDQPVATLTFKPQLDAEETMTTHTLTPTLTTSTSSRSITRYAAPCARVLMGLVFFVFGLDGFLHFVPQPTEPPSEGALSFGLALMKSGYMFPLIKGTEVVVGALLLSNRFVPLALVLIAPVVVNIFAFHAFLAPSGLIIASVIVALEFYLTWVYRSAYRPLLAFHTPVQQA